ncbi:virulence protein [Vibrio sp. vnigr-6D03]|uniref:VapE domain-containing protein n=1 Tax=Vibrio sp. vnigr-6D03 TaxID=2058088 RepID=UPI000C327B65|nr:VapE domain-containing protein [Vibrio sp. vnigr-6D03]PKF78224.1 virulence protein [Vibrio sp. vnigr-6D03]
MSNPNLAPIFPHVRYSDKGSTTVLNTADNLKALIEFSGLEAKLNKMTLEPDIFEAGSCIGAPEVVRSRLISEASIHSAPKSMIDDHFTAVAQQAEYHPVREWLEGEWDGVRRLDTVLNCVKAQNQELSNQVLTRWLVGCVASLYIPNFKSKLVPVLQGAQSFKKTAFVERIASVSEGAFLEGAELNPDNKDSVLSVIRSWIVELGELERSTKNCQGALKAFISRQVDTVRPPYGRTDIKKQRQTSLIATVNGTDFLKDETGNSRYAVIELKDTVDMDTLNKTLGWQFESTGEVKLVEPDKLLQFWLEIKYLLLVKKYSWFLSNNELTLIARESDKYVDKGAWHKVLNEHIDSCGDKARQWMTTKEICEFMKFDYSKANAVGKALTMLNKEGVLEKKLKDGVNRYCFPVVQVIEHSFR